MDEPAPPAVTISGGRGWVLDGRAEGLAGAGGGGGPGHPDVLGDPAERPPRTTTSRPRQVLALAAAAAVGFAASQLLAEQRLAALQRSPEGSLSLQAQADDAPGYVTGADGRLAVSLPVELRNTGPVAVVIETVELAGSALRDESAAGRSLPPGQATSVVLVRAVDCTEPPEVSAGPPPGALVVTARTPAGTQEARLRLAQEATGRLAGQERAACGLLPPAEALQFDVSVSQLRDGVGRLPIELRNASAQALLVTGVEPVDGLRLELLDASGEPAALPVRLPAGDFTTPRPPSAAGPTTRLTAVFTADCSTLPAEPPQGARPLLDVAVAFESGGPTATTGYGDGDRLLRRLVDAACTEAVGARR